MTFKSDIDGCFYLAIIVTAAALYPVSLPVMKSGSLLDIAVMAITILFSLGFLVWLALSTRYTITNTELIVRSGPFKWNIERSSIHGIAVSRSPISSPALSLYRLRIGYGRNRTMLVSPRDRDAFIEALSLED